jgi:peptidylprolyl isomerase
LIRLGVIKKPLNKKIFSAPILLSVLLISACSTNGGVDSMTGTQSSSFSFPSVTATAGKAPEIGKLNGAAPVDLKTQDVIVGTGKTAIATSTLEVHYVLMTWSDGKVVQSSWDSGQTATFPLSGVISGWQQGIPGMKEGGRRLLIIPPSLGYGASGSGPIAPNETLVFVVDLIKVS